MPHYHPDNGTIVNLSNMGEKCQFSSDILREQKCSIAQHSVLLELNIILNCVTLASEGNHQVGVPYKQSQVCLLCD